MPEGLCCSWRIVTSTAHGKFAKWFKKYSHLFPAELIERYKKNAVTPGGQQINTDLINSVVNRLEDGTYDIVEALRKGKGREGGKFTFGRNM